MFAPLPLLHVTAINKKKSGDDKSVFNCPVYKYAKRTDKYIIFRVNLNSESDPPSKWKLKGVALLCAKEWEKLNSTILIIRYIYIKSISKSSSNLKAKYDIKHSFIEDSMNILSIIVNYCLHVFYIYNKVLNQYI